MVVNEMRVRLRHKVIPAVPVPFDERGAIDPVLQDEYAQWMSRQDIGGVAIWAHTGRGLLLDAEERSHVLHSWRTACPETTLVCGAGVPAAAPLVDDVERRTSAALRAVHEMGSEAKVGGGDALLVYPPHALQDMPDLGKRIVDYHVAAADAGLPFLAFLLYERAGGVRYDPDVLGAICALDRCVGIKLATLDSVMTFQDLVASLRGMGGPLIVTGEDRFLGYSMQMGAEAALIGLAAGLTDQSIALIDRWFARDYAAFLETSAAIDAFARVTFREPMEGYVQRMLWTLEADGVLSRTAYDRHAPVMATRERSDVFNAVHALRNS